jgi:glycerol-3-phosphate dehydrogenase
MRWSVPFEAIGARYISDIQHRTRLGMGRCQGGFCTYRTLGIFHKMGRVSAEGSMDLLRDFLQRRFRGVRPILWGSQLREEQLVEGIYLRILGMEKEP